MIEAKVSDKVFSVKQISDGWEINGKMFHPDIVKLEDGSLSILLEGKSHELRIVQSDDALKSFSVSINNVMTQIELKDETDLLLQKLGMSATARNKLNELKAPMPGLVLKVLVSVGDTVKKGDSLLVLEAMKMENVIKATGEGKVKAIKIDPQDKVEKNHVLIVFE